MKVDFDFNYGKLERELDAIGKKALPKAVAGYLNGIAVEARKNLIKHNDVFDGHVKFTDRGWVYDKAKPSAGEDMYAVVKALPKQEAYLWFQIFGGKRKHGDAGAGGIKDFFVGADKTNAAGNIKWGYVEKLSKQNKQEKAARAEWRTRSAAIAERRQWDMSQYSPGIYQDLTWTSHVSNKPGIFFGTIGGMKGYWKRPSRTKAARKRKRGVISVRTRQGSKLTSLLSVAKTAAYEPIYKYDLQIEKAMYSVGGQAGFTAEFNRAMSKL